MKNFTRLLIGITLFGVIGVSSAKAANVSFGHNVINYVSGGNVGSDCYSSGTAFSKAKCSEYGKAIQVRVADTYGRAKSASSSGYNTTYTYTAGLTTAGNNNNHTHTYSVWTLS